MEIVYEERRKDIRLEINIISAGLSIDYRTPFFGGADPQSLNTPGNGKRVGFCTRS
jgi:hypothetical protein